MSLSKYPEQIDLFQYKRDATFEGDPNGDHVMAADINELQDAILGIESTLGVSPQGNKSTVGERITLLEGSSSLRVPSFLLYLGKPEGINGSATVEEAVAHYINYDHIVLGDNAGDKSDPDHQLVVDIIKGVKENKDTHFYGYIDAGVNTANLSVSELQITIQSWKDMGATGIYCANFGFESGINRERQNAILDSIHQYGLVAILQGQNPEEIFSDLYHETLNPSWVAPNIQAGDIYHYDKFVVDSASANKYPDFISTVVKMKRLYIYRKELGIKIFGTPLIQSNIADDEAQKLYSYAHSAALLMSLDGFYPVKEGYSVGINEVDRYKWMPIVGGWYVGTPSFNVTNNTYSRETAFGSIKLDTAAHTYSYDGIYIPYEMLQIQANTFEGSAIKDATIEDKKIKNYDGNRLIYSINNAVGDGTISINKISKFGYGDLTGTVSVEALQANVITAINARIGSAVIDQAVIGDLTADKIKAGTIDAERISASVVQAINMYAGHAELGSAYIHGAVIDELEASSIKAGTIDAERIASSVVEAINLSADQANIKNLNADNITAGNVKAERMQAEVINAINIYSESAVIDKAVINSAAIGNLSADKIKASVIEAINLSAENAFIKGAKIEEASIGQAHIVDGSITNAKIGDAEIDTAKIQLGSITSALIGEQQVDTANIALGSITDALIDNLSADKINAGRINTAYVSVQGPDGLLRINSNRLQVFDNSAVPVERVALGDVNGDGTKYGFRVRGADGKTVLYDEKGVYNEGITDGAITNPKIGDDQIDGRVIVAEAITADHIIADAIQSKHIMAEAINARHILAGSITAGSAIIADGAISNAQIADAAIGSAKIEKLAVTDAHIKELNADKINAGKIKAQYVEIGGNSTFLDGYNPATLNSQLRNDLKLKSPLPTALELSEEGIKATTPSNPNSYAKLDHRGLYIAGGAIQIDGGLQKENIDSGLTDMWDQAVQFTEDMADDNVISPTEKKTLKRDYDAFKAEHNSIVGQTDYYWGSAIDSPVTKDIYMDAYGAMERALTVTADSNNSKAILATDNMNNSSTVDGTSLNSIIQAYKVAKYNLMQDIARRAKDLADEAMAEIGELADSQRYDVEIISSAGNVFRNGDISATFQARIYKNGEEVTSSIPTNKVIWTRTSKDAAADTTWNQKYAAGAKSIDITKSDVDMKATFEVRIIE